MNLFVPVNQFEIRYTPILQFKELVSTVMAPYVAMAKTVRIEDENTVDIRLVLVFEENYTIVATWDRLIFRSEGPLENLIDNNSIFQMPFLEIFNGIKASEQFGKVTHYISYSLIININKQSKENILSTFTSRYLNNTGLNKIIGQPEDVGLIVEKVLDGKNLTVTFGPYLGSEDLQKRNVVPQTSVIKEIANEFGEIAEIKIHEKVNSFSLSKYKDIIKVIKDISESLWA